MLHLGLRPLGAFASDGGTFAPFDPFVGEVRAGSLGLSGVPLSLDSSLPGLSSFQGCRWAAEAKTPPVARACRSLRIRPVLYSNMVSLCLGKGSTKGRSSFVWSPSQHVC